MAPKDPLHAARVRRYIASFTDADWGRLSAAADQVSVNRPTVIAEPLDAPLRAVVCELEWVGRHNGERIGELRGLAVVVWETG